MGRIRGIQIGCLILAACSSDMIEPQDINIGEINRSNAYASGAGLSNESGSYYCINWFSGGPCWGMGLYATSNKQGSNTPPSNLSAPPAPAAEVIVMMCMSNCVMIEDSLMSKINNLVRCSAGGLSSYWLQGDTLTHSAGNPWDNCDANLANKGYTPNDVALILNIAGNSHPSGSLVNVSNYGQFANSYAKSIEAQVLGMGRTVKNRYPFASLGIIGLSATHHASAFLTEPFAFETGFGVRWALDKQDSTTSLMFWVAYNWNDNDPPSFYCADGVHPCAIGAGVRAEAIKQGIESSQFLPWYDVIGSNAQGSATWICDLTGCDFILTVNGAATNLRLP